MTIIQQPDALSLSRNLKSFQIASDTQFSFIFSKDGEELLSQVYDSGDGGVAEIDLRDIVHARLSYDFRDSSQVYQQEDLVGDFTAKIDDTTVNFRVVRGGVDRLADSAANFLFARCERMPAAQLYAALRRRGVLVRYFDAPRTADWLRITIGTREQMEALFAALDAILKEG